MHGTLQRSSSAAQNLASLFRSAARLPFRRTKTSASTKRRSASPNSSSSAAAPKKKTSSTTSSSSPNDAQLKAYITSVKSAPAPAPAPASVSPSASAAYEETKREQSRRLLSSFKAPPSTVPNPPSSSLISIVSGSLAEDCTNEDDESAEHLASDISGMLYDEMDLDWDDDDDQESPKVLCFLELPWLTIMSNSTVSALRKEFSQDKKQKWVFKYSVSTRYQKLMNLCATKFGSDLAVDLFGKLGRENGLKEFNALIKICIKKARATIDEDVSLEQIYKVYQLLKLAREMGFQIQEEMYGQFLMYLIDFGMCEEFFFFHELIREDNPDSLPRLTYYEMLLRIRVDDDKNFQEFCLSVATEDDDDNESFYRREALLLALCESDRKQELQILLETLDISKVTSVAVSECIFRSLGKFLLESFAERFLLVLKGNDIGAEDISKLILEYAISIPNLAVEGIIRKFQALHTKFEVLPTSAQYEKLIGYSCEIFKVHEALNVVDEAFKSGITLPLEIFHSILCACDRSCDFNLVHQIYSRISHYNLEPNNETFRWMILLCVKMKDFEGAYQLIKKISKPTTGMYNAILAGYFREKKNHCALNVLKQMEDADVKPDAMTYSYLIANSQHEEDIAKYYEDMNNSRVAPTKQVFMALINAYASFGNSEYAKELILNKRIPAKDLNDIKSALVGALASNGMLSDALELYEEMKGAKCDLNPKAIKSLIEHYQSEGQLDKSLELLEELNDSPYWIDSCFRVISHCVRHENLRSTVDLMKQLKERFVNAEVALEVLFDEVFCLYVEQEPTDMQFGLHLLEAVKEEVGVRPSRKSLDFLLSACTYTKDVKSSFLIWKEYERAGLPYNVLSFVRMYQALLASGDKRLAAKLLNKIPQSDDHVRCVIEACQKTYGTEVRRKETKKKKALRATLSLLDSLEAKTE